MAFDCTFPGIRLEVATALTRDAVAARAATLGLTAAYVVASIEVVPRRWRGGVVDVVVHMRYGADVLHPQFPDEARRVVTDAVNVLLQEAAAPVQSRMPVSDRSLQAHLPPVEQDDDTPASPGCTPRDRAEGTG